MGRAAALDADSPWPLISAFRKGPEQIVQSAHRFGVNLDQFRRADGHPSERFPKIRLRTHETMTTVSISEDRETWQEMRFVNRI